MQFVKGDTLRDAIREYHHRKEWTPTEKTLGIAQTVGPPDRRLRVGGVRPFPRRHSSRHQAANIMLGKFGETLLVDWGLAKVMHDAPSATQTSSEAEETFDTGSHKTPATMAGTKKGTPAYMSPEQGRGDIATVGTHSDVYSLGATLYHLLTGQPPLPAHRKSKESSREA